MDMGFGGLEVRGKGGEEERRREGEIYNFNHIANQDDSLILLTNGLGVIIRIKICC